ncbi:MAG TPA: hypothetical protein VFX73_05205 [Chitinophagaceae bacterium]|jgi:hypothetical protein|nr:hypothetical protein [Chitinophagaceae bacterium]
MKKYILTLLMAFFVILGYATEKGKWTGFISDDHCGVKSANEGHAECAKKCIKDGKATVIVVGDKMYKISDPKKVEEYIGQKVTIEGNLKDDVIEVKKVSKS